MDWGKGEFFFLREEEKKGLWEKQKDKKILGQELGRTVL